MKAADALDLRIWEFAGNVGIAVDAGPRGSERVVPPAGEAHAFDRRLWAHKVELSVSPTGRSVRVFLDGTEVAWPADEEVRGE